MDRRDALAAALAATVVGGLGGAASGQVGGQAGGGGRGGPILSAEELGYDAATGAFVLPKLPYAPEALEPHIDKATMEIHHGRHHLAYVNGLNKALGELKKIREGQGDAALIKHWSREVSFHGGGHVNHSLFWKMMAPPKEAGGAGGGEPEGALAAAIARDFGSFAAFATHFKAASVQVEASGWGWLVLEPSSGRLMVIQGEKQQDLMVTGVVPLLGVDVWEHAYYLRYQNKRADYVNAFMNVVNWPFVAGIYARYVG